MVSCSNSIQMRATSFSGSICQMINDIPAIYSYIPLRWFYTQFYQMKRAVLPGELSEKTKPVDWNSFTISEGRSDSPVDWYPLASWIIPFFSSTLPTLIRHSAQKPRKESNWSLSKVKSVCPLSLAPFVPFARLSDFHKIVKWIYEPKTRETEKLGKRSEKNKTECESTRLFGEVLSLAIKRRATVIAVREEKREPNYLPSREIFRHNFFRCFSAFIAFCSIFLGSLTLIKIFEGAKWLRKCPNHSRGTKKKSDMKCKCK